MFRFSLFVVFGVMFLFNQAEAKGSIELSVYVNQDRGVLEIEGTASKPLLLPLKAMNSVSKGENAFKYDYPLPKMGGNGYETKAELASPLGIYIPSHWYPGSRKNAVHSMSYKVTVKAKNPWIVVVPGQISAEKKQNGTYTATFTKEEEVNGISLIAGEYAYEQSKFENVTFRVYMPNKFKKMLGPYVQATKMFLNSYHKTIGEFAYPYYVAISSPVRVRSSNSPGFTLLDVTQLLDVNFLIGTYSHELLHNYWGSGVYGPLNFANWAEGLTTYMSGYVFLKGQRPAWAQKNLEHWQKTVEKAKAVSVLKFKGHTKTELQDIGYYKVALVFHMLKQRLGDEAFYKMTRRIWKNLKFKSAMWSDFERYSAEVSGRDVGPFFDKWVRGKKAPSMADLNQKKLETKRASLVSSTPTPQSAPNKHGLKKSSLW